jgi:hypothetical protein
MFTATVAVSVLLAALVVFSAARKLGHRPEVVRTYTRVGVPEDKLDYLAMVLFAGAAGLLIGLLWAPMGVAAAIGLVCYFLVALAAHIRARDFENMPTPFVIELLAVTALTLRVATL